jgi:myo-inositol-1-phosphate synthase
VKDDADAAEVLPHLQRPDHDVVLAVYLTQFLIPLYHSVHLVYCTVQNWDREKQTESQLYSEILVQVQVVFVTVIPSLYEKAQICH